MVALGLLFIIAGALIVLAGVFSGKGTVEMFGLDISAQTHFLLGVAAGALILWGLSLMRFGTKRSLARRKETKRLNELNRKLERAENERRADEEN